MTVIGELELAWRLLPNRFVAVTGTNGKTTVVELLGHVYRDGRRAGRGRRQRRHAARLAGRRARRRRDGRLRVLVASSSRTRVAFAPECAVFLNLAPTTSTATARSTPTSRRSCGSSPTRATTTSRSTTPTTPALAGDRPPGGWARRGRLRLDGCADGRLRGVASPTERSSTTASRCSSGRSSPLAGEHNVAQRDGRGRGGARAGPRPRGRRARACAASPASRTGSSRSPRSTASLFVNDSKATNVASAAAALGAFDGGVHAILGGSDKGERFDAAGRPGRASAASPAT